MKVLCINSTGWMVEKIYLFGLYKKLIDSTGPVYGEVNTVVGQFYDNGLCFYELLEWPEKAGGYLADEFIPISEIDETEFEREHKKDKVIK